MIKYQVADIPEAKAQLVKGDFLPGSIPVRFPENEKTYRRYKSLFLNQKDIETGLDSLFLVREELHPQIVYSLFTTALVNLIKCFQKNDDRVSLNEHTFLKRNKAIKQSFTKFKNWRNNYFVHDGNGTMDSRAFLFVAPESSGKTLGGRPSVVWRTVLSINYLQEAKELEKVMQCVWRFIVGEIDSMGNLLYEKYSKKTREELLGYGVIGVSVEDKEYPIEEIKAMRPKESFENEKNENA